MRMLRLTYVQPSALQCALFFEGSIALAVLLSLAELVSWWAVLLLPVSVAALVKINDIVKGAYARTDDTRRIPLRRKPSARGVAPVAGQRAADDPDGQSGGTSTGRHGARSADLDAPTEILPPGTVRHPTRRNPPNQRRFNPPVGGLRRTDPRDQAF
jgi:hypothetical protein